MIFYQGPDQLKPNSSSQIVEICFTFPAAAGCWCTGTGWFLKPLTMPKAKAKERNKKHIWWDWKWRLWNRTLYCTIFMYCHSHNPGVRRSNMALNSRKIGLFYNTECAFKNNSAWSSHHVSNQRISISCPNLPEEYIHMTLKQ